MDEGQASRVQGSALSLRLPEASMARRRLGEMLGRRPLREPSSGRCGRVHSVLKREFGVSFDAPSPGAFGLRVEADNAPAASHAVIRPARSRLGSAGEA
jgi:hypothetical protein